MYTLERSQLLAVEPPTVWDFIKNPANLNMITPPDLDFRIVSDIPEVMKDGLIVVYEISVPIFGNQEWVTEIKHINQGHSFVDEQRLGPYRFWYHYHEISRYDTGTRMLDRVHFELPFGFAGKIIYHLFVARTLKRIFDYRFKRFEELFNKKQH